MPANAWVSARRYLCYMIGAAYLRASKVVQAERNAKQNTKFLLSCENNIFHFFTFNKRIHNEKGKKE